MRCMKFLLAGFLTMSGLPALAQTPTLLGVNGGGESSSSPGAVVSVNPATGAVTVLSTPLPGLGLTGVAMNSAGRVFAVTGTADTATGGPRLLELNPATGAVIANVGRLQTAGGDDCYIGDLSFQPGTDVLFAILGNQGPAPRCGIPTSRVGGYLLTINTTNARVTVVGRDSALDNSNGGLAFAPNGTLYFTPCWDNAGVMLTLYPDTAAIKSSVTLTPNSCYMGLAVRSDGVIFGSYDDESGSNSIYTINPASGSRTLVGSTGGHLVHDLVFLDAANPAPVVAQQVPTLSEWVLLALGGMVGLSGVAWLRRRQYQ
jgi:hypothetical protein